MEEGILTRVSLALVGHESGIGQRRSDPEVRA